MKVFGREKCPSPLVSSGRMIARKSYGLPLAVVLMAGVLTKDGTTAAEWERIAEYPLPVICEENQKSCNEVVKLSYDHLPNELKHCFLYLGVFRIRHEIDARKLIRLWIAEGFIMGDGFELLEVTGEKFLEDLVDRNLVMVLGRRADGGISMCCIHDTVHEFCKTEAANEGLFYEMDGGRVVELNEMSPRRICVHSSIMDFIKSENKPSGEHVSSFLSFCSNQVENIIPREHLPVIPICYPFLTVMDVESLKFTVLPKEFYKLYHLRYLALSTDLKLLPEPFSDLWNMQTLVFNTSAYSLEVRADIWSMPKLRHVHTNTPMLLPPPRKNANNSSGSIQTLSNISPSSCTGEILKNTPNLRKLRIHGDLTELLESRGGVVLFDNLQILNCLENLKLINTIKSYAKLPTLLFPHADKFPRMIRKMTLSETRFEWKDLNILSSLEELQVLKLKHDAFRGEFCDVSNTVFKQLQYLLIGWVNLVSWKVSKDSFPALKCLHIKYCTDLDAIPADFGEVESLKAMDLLFTNIKASKSALEIQKLNGFQLSIFHPV